MILYSFSSIFVITLFLLVVIRKLHKRAVLMAYYCIMIVATILSVIIFENLKIFSFRMNIPLYFWLTIITISFYCIETMFVNMIVKQVLILDWRFYFKGKIDFIGLIISTPLLIMEEIVFRLPIINVSSETNIKVLLLVFSSICFGAVHLFFSKHDAIAKVFLGLVMSFIFVISGNIIITIFMHLIYNMFAFRKQRCPN